MISGKIRLSYNALKTLAVCERKFQLDRLLVGSFERKDSPATVLGTAYGVGVASYLLHQDREKALWDTFLAYWPAVEDEKRTLEVCLNLLISSFPTLDNILLDWEIAVFQEKPAVELSFAIHIDSKFYYVGYADVVLRNKWNGRHAVLDAKTTSLSLFNLDPLYQNSGQVLGYSIVLDQIVGQQYAEYDCLYLAAQLGAGNGFSPKIQLLTYPKTLQDRLSWFITLGIDVERLHRMLELESFPLRGDSCLQYMRPCVHMGTCSLHGLDEYKELEDDPTEYQFVFQLEQLIENHIARIQEK
jgi:hypothetical protein